MKERSLSGFWREETDDPVLEMLSVLQGARNLIGLMGSGLRVRWSGDGRSYTNLGAQVVSLDYGPLASCKGAPFPGGVVDEVIGYAAHEGGHCMFSAADKDQVIPEEIRRQRKLSPSFRRAWQDGQLHPLPDGRGGWVNPMLVELCQVQNILEDAYVDTHVGQRWEVLGEHIKVARQRMKERNQANGQAPDLEGIAKQAQPSRSEITALWVNISLYGEPRPRRCSARVRKALDFLMERTETAIQTHDPTERQRMTVGVGDYLWRYFPDQQPQQKAPDDSGDAQSSPGPGQGQGQGQESGDTEQSGDEPQDSQGADGDEPQDGQDADGDEPDSQDADGDEPDSQGADGEPQDARAEIIRRLKEILEQRAEDKSDSSSSSQADDDGAAGQDDSGAGDAPGLPEDPDGFDHDPMDVPEEILEAIAEALELELEDLSQEVAEILGEDPRYVAAHAQKARYDKSRASNALAGVGKQVAEVQRAFDQQKQAASRYLTGLSRGKVNGRQLARVGAGDLNVFQRKQVLSKPDMDVGLLLDVSGSMHGYASVVDQTAAIFAEALSRKQGVNFAAWAYTAMDNLGTQVQLTRLCDRSMGKLHLADVTRDGGTPSGPAIAGVKVMMGRMPGRTKVLIHFTDGDPDSGQHVFRAVAECRKAGIEVRCIALAGKSHSLDFQYGRGNWKAIQSVPDLPKAVMEIIKNLS